MDDDTNPEDEAPDFDTPVPVDKDGEPRPKDQEKRKPRRGSDPSAPKIVAARVQRIAVLMSEGQWSYAAAFSLAMDWGLKVSTVQQYATHAGNLLDLLVSSDKMLRTRMLMTLDAILSKAMSPVDAKGRSRQPQLREAIEAVKVMAGLAGLDKAYEASKANTAAVVGLTDVIGAAARAAVAANAAAEDESSKGTDDDGSGD